HRYSEIKVFGRGGGRRHGRSTIRGAAIDAEMQALGYKRLKTIRDANVENNAEAEFYAMRKVAEFARAGFLLRYVVAGHRIPTLRGGGRAVWTPDTCVEVDDDIHGLRGTFWLESVEFRRPPTTTTLALLRPEHLVFGAD